MGINATLFYGFFLKKDQFDLLPFGKNKDYDNYEAWLVSFAEPGELPDNTICKGYYNEKIKLRERISGGVECDYYYCDDYLLPYFYKKQIIQTCGQPIQFINWPEATFGDLCALRNIAKRLKISNPSIGWWLVS